jgi:hypothetical protein
MDGSPSDTHGTCFNRQQSKQRAKAGQPSFTEQAASSSAAENTAREVL